MNKINTAAIYATTAATAALVAVILASSVLAPKTFAKMFYGSFLLVLAGGATTVATYKD